MPSPDTRRPIIVRVAARVGRFLIAVTLILSGSTLGALTWFHVHDQQLYTVLSGSMAPTFNAGDVVIVDRPKPSLLVPGAVISFHAPGNTDRLTTHRILSLKNKPYGHFVQTKGDHNLTPDPDFTPVGSIVGVMSGTVPWVGRWLVFYASRTGRVLVVGLPLLLLVLAQFLSLLGRLRRTQPVEHEQVALDVPPAARAGGGFGSPLRVVSLTVAIVLASVTTGILLGQHTNAVYTASTPVNGNRFSTGTFCGDTYRPAAAADSPIFGAYLDEISGTTVNDSTGGPSGQYVGAYTLGVPGALKCGGHPAVHLAGPGGMIASSTSGDLPAMFTMEVWFKTSVAGGRILGLSDNTFGASAIQERVLYMNNAGQIVFGVISQSHKHEFVTSPGSYADGKWHLLTATAQAGITLYLDGAAVISDPSVKIKVATGFQRAGWDTIEAGWPTIPTNKFFTGDLDEISGYNVSLTAARVAAHFAAN